MKRYILATAAALLAFPASALASASSGVVLSVDAKQHMMQVVDSRHAVHLYHYRGRLPRLHPGSTIRFDRSGRVITHVRGVSNKSRTVVFDARVVRSSSRGLSLMTADGKVVTFTAKQLKRKPAKSTLRRRVLAHAADTSVQINVGNVSINILGLQPGVTVQVTETTDSSGSVTVTITLPSPSQTSGQQQASGVVTEVGDDAFEMQLADGSDLRLHMSPDALAALSLSTCNTVSVSYHQDAGLLLADTVQVTGNSTTGDCTPTQDATGTIGQVSGQSLTLTTDQGSLTFTVTDSSLTDGFQSGDVVDVTYVQNPDGSLTATDVQYVQQDATGTVTAVNATSMTITDSNTGQPDTFAASPNGVQVDGPSFQGVSVGDQVDVTYHTSAGQMVADSVCDSGPAGSGSGGSSNGGSSGD